MIKWNAGNRFPIVGKDKAPRSSKLEGKFGNAQDFCLDYKMSFQHFKQKCLAEVKHPNDTFPFQTKLLLLEEVKRCFGRQRMSQSRTIWMADCYSMPRMHLGVSSMAQGCRHVPTRPTLVLNLFNAAHRFRGSSEPDCRQTAGVTRNWACGVALSHAVLHESRRLKPEFSSAASWRWKGHRKCRRCVPRNCTLWTRVWMGWLVFSCAWSVSLKVECSLRRWTCTMPVSKGESSLRVGFRHPEMMRNVSFNAASGFFVWGLRHQVGAAYSAAP